MKLLVLGGTTFLGPAVVDDAKARGWLVTCLHRGRSGSPPDGVESIIGDRTDPAVLEQLQSNSYDVVLDTWSGAPHVARDSAKALSNSTGTWVYVSSRSVYAWPLERGGNEGAPTVEADADADASNYPADKRGAELALTRELGNERVILARAGLILGPRENVGRLPWWLHRIARGGEFLAPGPSDLPLQYVDSRDLATFCLDAAAAGRSGPVDSVSRPGATTMGGVIAACQLATKADASALWIDGDWLISQEVEPWTELPIWIPASSESYRLHDGDTSRAARWGLRTRPIAETVDDTWSWLMLTKEPMVFNAHSATGMDPDRESELRSLWRNR